MKKGYKDGLVAKGFYRLNIHEHKNGKVKVIGDSGWVENQITNSGYANFIVGPMTADTNSSRIGWAALGTGTAPGAANTNLNGELAQVTNNRFSLVATLTGSKSAQFTGSLNSGINNATAAIANVGLFASSNVTAGTVAAGNTYATSTLFVLGLVEVTLQRMNLPNSVKLFLRQCRAKLSEMKEVCNEHREDILNRMIMCSVLCGNMQRLAEMTSPTI